MRKVASKHPFCIFMYMYSYIFHIYLILFIFSLNTCLIFDFICLTLSLVDTHGIAKYARVLAGGNMWDSLSCLLTLLESFDRNNLEMGIDSVARQMHQKTVQHYWVNILSNRSREGGVPTLRDTLIQPMEAALNQPTFLTQALLG